MFHEIKTVINSTMFKMKMCARTSGHLRKKSYKMKIFEPYTFVLHFSKKLNIQILIKHIDRKYVLRTYK